jgi:hypothetical protein
MILFKIKYNSTCLSRANETFFHTVKIFPLTLLAKKTGNQRIHFPEGRKDGYSSVKRE